MIKSILLRFGPSTDGQPLEFEPGPMTVFVGPNNSGKSLALREIAGKMKLERVRLQILGDVGLHRLSGDDILRFVHEKHPTIRFDGVDNDREIVLDSGNFLGGTTSNSTSVRLGHLLSNLNVIHFTEPISRLAASASTIILDGYTRLSLTNAVSSRSLQDHPAHLLMALFKDNDARERIRSIVYDAFDLYFVIDPTEMQQFRVRMSLRPPVSVDEEKSLDTPGIEFHRQATLIEELSDGVKAYTGLVAATFSANFKAILIDEPEAFLYPPLARKLGKVLTQTAAERNGNILCATHSSDFLMGCVQSGSPANIVRLTYQRGVATARILPGGELQRLMRDPLLRSTGVLDALFYQGTIVCEGDIDRALYEEVNERLLAQNEGGKDVLFVNAVGKQTIRKIIAPLRGMGIPAAAVVDLDILKKGDLSALLRAASVPDQLVETWDILKKRVLDEFVKLSLDPKEHGLGVLDQPSQEAAANLIMNAAEYGVFIVAVGEVERWLSHLGIPGKKMNWLIPLFERMGVDSADPNYIHPENGDIWDFVRQIAAWIANPNRKGIPE